MDLEGPLQVVIAPEGMQGYDTPTTHCHIVLEDTTHSAPDDVCWIEYHKRWSDNPVWSNYHKCDTLRRGTTRQRVSFLALPPSLVHLPPLIYGFLQWAGERE